MRKALFGVVAAIATFALTAPAFAQQQQQQQQPRDEALERVERSINEDGGRSRVRVEERRDGGSRVTVDVTPDVGVYVEGNRRETRPNDDRSGEVVGGGGVSIRFGRRARDD